MLARLKMKLKADKEEFGYYQSSNLQGVLMEHIDGFYAEQLHMSGLKPYSQYVFGKDEKEWVVTTLTEEAYEKIILPLIDDSFQEFDIEKKNIHVEIQRKELETTSKKTLLDEFYSAEYDRYLNLEFLTPTAFRSDGQYVIMPDVRLIYQSLMNKYSSSSDEMNMYDEETLEQLVNSSKIVQYRLRSATFPLEGVKIPAFKGELSIKIVGNATMARYARLLARFGEYSGLGIKTAIGMGALQMKKRGDRNER